MLLSTTRSQASDIPSDNFGLVERTGFLVDTFSSFDLKSEPLLLHKEKPTSVNNSFSSSRKSVRYTSASRKENGLNSSHVEILGSQQE